MKQQTRERERERKREREKERKRKRKRTRERERERERERKKGTVPNWKRDSANCSPDLTPLLSAERVNERRAGKPTEPAAEIKSLGSIPV
jgi:hypothetical protein